MLDLLIAGDLLAGGVPAIVAVGPFAQTQPFEGSYWDVAAAVALGFGIAAVARLLVPRVRSVSWPTSAILAALAGSLSFGLASALDRDPTLLALLLTLVLTILFLLVGTVVEHRFRPVPDVHDTPTAELIRIGESTEVEFKSTARRNTHTGERDPVIESMVARTVCGFLNGRGGTLLVGVTDEGEVLGIGPDLPLVKVPDVDRYELFVTDLLRTSLGLPAMSRVRIGFDDPVADGGAVRSDAAGKWADRSEDAQLVCRIDVEPSPVPVYMTPPRVKGGGSPEPEFWVRTGNGTRSLRIDEMLDYHRSRWGRWFRRVFSE